MPQEIILHNVLDAQVGDVESVALVAAAAAAVAVGVTVAVAAAAAVVVVVVVGCGGVGCAHPVLFPDQ